MLLCVAVNSLFAINFVMCNNNNNNQALSLLFSTAINSNQSTPACSPVLRKRSGSSTLQLSPKVDSSMVEKGSSDQGSDRSPTTPEQQQVTQHQRPFSQPVHPANTGARSGGKNSKVSTQKQSLA